MQPRHRVSRAAIELIKRFEGYRRKAAELPDGRWTIGHGHTLTARRGAEVSADDAEALLLYDLIGVTATLNACVFSPLTQNQFDALAAFAFSIGAENFCQSGVLKRLNEGSPIQAACAMELWRKAAVGGERIVVDALVRRRSAEKTLFLTPMDGAWMPAPSVILRPQLDTDALDVVPLEAPSRVTASMEGETIVVTREFAPLQSTPSPQDEADGPTKTAAEAVTARLQTIFQEPAAEPAQAEPPVRPQNIPDAPQPQADSGPPPGALAETSPPEAATPQVDQGAPFGLYSPLDGDAEGDPMVGADLFETAADDDLAGPDLFAVPPVPYGADEVEADAERKRSLALANDPAAPPGDDPDADLAFLSRLPDSAQDLAFATDTPQAQDFVAPAVQPLPEQPRGGILTLVASAVLGLAFFGGGVFWATNARPMTGNMWLDPRVVGWLAVLSGIGFFTVSAFVLLERLGQASERSARYRR